MTPRTPEPVPRDEARAPKATLICPACGHESGTDGDWLVRSVEGCRVYECPDCGADIDSRPAR